MVTVSETLDFIGRESLERYPEEAREEILSPEGALLLVQKDYGETSFYTVNRIRKTISRATGIRRVKCGHAGTLDPLATGLLIIATRRKTKELAHLTGMDKTYLVKMRFGVTSPSFDLERPIEIVGNESELTEASVSEALYSMSGEQEQIPPIYSAIKQGGKAVYLSARKGETPVMTARTIAVHDLEIVSMNLPYLTFRAHVSKGTYIRSMVRDLAERLGTAGVLVDLEREAIGPYCVSDALTVPETLSLILPRS